MNRGISKTEQIIIELGKQIVDGKYILGAALPSESDLCEEFETSRNIIREVFRALVVKGLIEVKRFKGAYVTNRTKWNYLDSDVLKWSLENNYDPRLIASINETRSLLEPTMAKWAALRATPADLVLIEEALNGMIKNTLDIKAFNQSDVNYHEAILTATHNPILQQIGVIFSAIQWAVFDKNYSTDESNVSRTIKEHRELYDAIRRQDADAAEKAALVMISNATKKLKGKI